MVLKLSVAAGGGSSGRVEILGGMNRKSLRVSCPILFEFLICPDAWLKPQGLGGSYLQRVLRGFRMSIHLMFHVFAAFLAASF